MSYSQEETNFGIKNFRREFGGLVASLATLAPISNLESLSTPDTFNKRFKQLSDAVRHCFNAAGDIAIRDKRYLETFLSGYANPIVSQVFNGTDLDAFTNFPAYNVNGTPITFAESRVMYNVSSLGELNTAACYVWVFVDGIKQVETDYSILNTAYGVKCFIKSTRVTATSEVNIVVNRIFNTSKDASKITVTGSAKNSTYLIPVSQLGVFYHYKYIKVFVKRGNDPKLSYLEVPRENLVVELDTTGTTLKVNVRDWQLYKDEVLHIMNTVYYWKYNAVINLSVTNEVELTEVQTDGSYRPVPFSSIHDFDVFYGGYKLVPGKHYTIIKGGNNYSAFKLKLLFSANSSTTPRLEIFKNEAVTEDKDFIYVLNPNIGTSGVLTSSSMTTLPMSKNIGQCYIAGRRVGYDKLDVKHKRFMTLTGVIGNKDVEYSQRIVSSLDIENVLNFLNTTTSETDLVAEWIGFDVITAKLLATVPPIVVDAGYNKTIAERYTSYNHFDASTAAIEQFRMILNAYVAGTLVNGLVLDPNVSPQSTDFIPIDVVDKFLTIDGNFNQYASLVIDPNVIFI
jgi:hypothetical protein